MLFCPFCVKSKVHLSCGEVFYYEGPRETTVVFDPQEGGDQTGFLTISSDDPDRPVVTIEVAGVGLSVGDFDGDGSVGFSDFLIFAQVFGTNDTKCDIDGDGSVGFADFLLFAAEFGK